jgi:phage/plasmid-like protein (TIGR03299 family)
MPPVIFGNRFRFNGEPAWHGIGEPMDDDQITAAEAFQLAGIDYEVYRSPLFAEINGKHIELEDQFAVIRDKAGLDEAQFLATCGKEFRVVQNMEIAESIDNSGLLNSYSVETVGALGNGETIFTALKKRNGEFEIAGTPAVNYWTLYDGKDGNKALGIMWTPVKVVCSNTLVMALKSASISIKIQHTKQAKTDFDFWLSLAPQMERMQDESMQAINHLTKFNVTEEMVDAIIEAAYPRPKDVGKAQLKNLVTIELSTEQRTLVDKAISNNERAALRQWQKGQLAKDLFIAYADTDGERELAGTAWGVYEAICDVEDHREPSRESENIFASAMFGQRANAKKAAFTQAMKVAGIKN